ncbi:MAG TPA: sigma 54-interacting transcriptional regulator [Gemmataceae bacterium]|nr:sigma 54-interacting transcriptional regulator [Gemmataceae bacterium]
MAAGTTTAYLVVRRDDGFGDVFALVPGQRFTLGRANTNRIVLKDEQCSREHAEVYFADGRWCLRDLNSLNGTRINSEPLDSEWELAPNDEINLGHTRLVFVEQMGQLPDMPAQTTEADGLAIKKRQRHTRFLTPIPPLPAATSAEQTPLPPAASNLNRHLSLLYRLALDMGTAADQEELVGVVLDGLLEATPADVGAILAVKEGPELELLAHRHRDPKAQSYNRVSEYVSREVMQSKEAVLAENVAEDRHLRIRDSLADIGATSLICAPVIFRQQVLALIHLYCTDPTKTLDADALEFAMALAGHLGAAMHQLTRQESLTAENRSLRDQLRVESELVGNSDALRSIESQVARVADTNATVLIRGESGSGKELVARAIHFSSPRKDGPFICLNCAALSETLLESELFGHEKGAFTGATDKKVGKFESADHGTIFLDEIGEMSIGTQAKLLRVLEGHPFERVGGSTPIKVDVRVVSATNQPLEQALQDGHFRRDLFFRLQVVEIRVPPLRERRSDIPLLADHFLKRFVRETGRRIRGFTPAAIKKMEEYHWPGNVRELRNMVERAVALGTGPTLDAADVWLSSLEAGGPVPLTREAPVYNPVSLEEIEKEHILHTLAHTDWNKSQAATILNIERSTLDRKIKSYELKR